MNVETRWLFAERLLGLLGVGVAGFLDHGGAWYHGSPRRTGTDAGLGLRVASIREMGSVWRIDLARRFESDRLPSELVFSVGRGFLF
jgi:outer membrane translocation and assembly module TamA